MRVLGPLSSVEHGLGDLLASAELFPFVTRWDHLMIKGGLIPLSKRDVRELAKRRASFSSPNAAALGSCQEHQLNTHGS